jgi:PAS domain S-box-containing protein
MPTAADNPRPEVDRAVYAQQVGLLYGHAPLAYSATLINGLILIFVQRAHFPPAVLLGWFACLALVTAGRIGLVYRYHRVHPSPAVARRWAWQYGIGVGLAGITWGSAAVLLFPPGAIGPQVMVAFVLAGMTAAGLLVLAARFEAVVVFLLPALLPLILQFFLQNSELHTAMGVMTLLYLGGLLGIAAKMHRLIADVLSLRFDNHALVEEASRRQRAEDDLREGEARLRRVLDGANDGFWDWNVATGAVLVSRHGIEMLGYQPDDLAPHIASWEKLVHPDDRPLRQPALDAHFAGETPHYQAEYRLRAKAGDWRWVLVRGKVTARDAAGRPLWMAGTHTDITDRRLIEEALCDTLVRMQHRADQMSALNRMNDLLLSCETGEEAYQIIGRSAARLFDGCPGGLAIREDASPDHLRVVATWGVAPTLSATFPPRDCWALRRGGLYEMSDPAHGVPCRHFTRAVEHAYLCLPLIVRGETIGLLHVGAGGALAEEQFQDSRTLALTVGESTKLVSRQSSIDG